MSGDKIKAKVVVASNRRARFDFFIDETIEVGLMLTGTEVKSLRSGKASIAESYATDQDGELFLINASIPIYERAHKNLNHEPRRHRKLLIRRKDLGRLVGNIQRKGVTLIPMSIYFNERGIAKLELGIARGKKLHDKWETSKTRDWGREKARLMREKG